MPVLVEGPHVYLWPDGARVDVPKIAAELRGLGCVGVLVHEIGWPTWLDAKGVDAIAAAGLQLTYSFGSRGPSKWQWLADLSVRALRLGAPVMNDWEEAWCAPDGRASATRLVDRVLAAVPDAAERYLDCPWWAPLFTIDRAGKRRPTHPRAPTREFGRLCARDRYVQCYGTAAGVALRKLAWARSPTQYASLGAWNIRASTQSFGRSLQDNVDVLLVEKTQCVWNYGPTNDAMDANCRLGLRVVHALRGFGFNGPGAVTGFQHARGLVPDGIVGPKTLGALGLAS